mgnify:FL=1
MPRPVLIAGPTASGKSALALALAEATGGVVINADALQVYDGWRRLTARPSAEDEARAPHRLYGHVPLEAGHSAGRWLREAAAELDAAEAAGRRAIVVGGTGLLFAALTEGLADAPATPPEIRAEADRRLAAQGLDALVAELRARDPETAARVDLANPRRVARAWEVLEATGRPLAQWWRETGPPRVTAAHRLRLAPPREALARRIAGRFEAMLEAGALDEVRAALVRGPSPQAWKALGARELAAHLAGEISLAAAREAAVTATRRYAKRQFAWGRNRMADWPTAPDGAAGLDALLAAIAREGGGAQESVASRAEEG